MVDVVIVGAGMSGLVAAREVTAAGIDAVVLDKGHRVGGRLASRRVAGGRFDTGAQFVTLRDETFAPTAARLQDAGALVPWFRGTPDLEPDGDGHTRYRGAPAMRSLADALAEDLDVRTGTAVRSIRRAGRRWRITTRRDTIDATAVVLTAPVPQSLALLDAGGVTLPGEIDGALRDVRYDPCWSVLVRPDGTPDLPETGALRLADHPLHFIADNHRKGVSEIEAVTLHASADTTRELFDADGDRVARALLEAASPWLRGRAVHIHRWRYSAPIGAVGTPALATATPGPMAFAGDAFTGGRVEGAGVSGLAAAERLLAIL